MRVVFPMLLVAVLAMSACSGTAAAPAAAIAAPTLDGVDCSPNRVIAAGEAFTFTARGQGTAATEWQTSAGVLSGLAGASTAWMAVKPGGQVRPGRVLIEVRVAAADGGQARGGTLFLTVDDQGRASCDGFVANTYSGGNAATPTPGLTPPPQASPLPADGTPPSPPAAAPTGSAAPDLPATS